jgi:hypothetical protein
VLSSKYWQLRIVALPNSPNHFFFLARFTNFATVESEGILYRLLGYRKAYLNVCEESVSSRARLPGAILFGLRM